MKHRNGETDTDARYAARNTDGLARLRAHFETLIDLPVTEHEAWLLANIADADERTALRRLLAADHDRTGFLDTPPGAHASRLTAESGLAEDLVGQRIGSFRLVRLLGTGGMAAVFLGKREGGDFDQQVAIKLLRRGLYSEVEQRLFLRERQVLANLNHPHIARLFDGGVTEAGIPYLVMEYVDGVPITRHALRGKLGVRAKLELFLTVCRAVETAHNALIVHRDIKPSNILVTADGGVKLLDFGIAKLLEEDVENATIGVYTPGYAAPEQIHAGVITTATDVYSLGVLLHELLLDVKPLGSPPMRPSSLAATRQRVNADSPHSPAQLINALRGDLDNIILKALAAEPERRYRSASALADDVQRHLSGEAVDAHPPSTWYRARKFVSRHRSGVVATAGFLLAMFAALAIALWQTGIARNQAQRASEVQAFLEELFQPLEDGQASGDTIKLQDLLKRGHERIEQRYPDNPQVRAELLAMFARINEGIGENRDNRELAEAAWRANMVAFGADDPRTLHARATYGLSLSHLGQYREALEEYQAVSSALRTRGIQGRRYADILNRIIDARSAMGDLRSEEDIALQREVLDVVQRADDATPADLVEARVNLGLAYRGAYDYDQARHNLREAYELEKATSGDSRDAAHILGSLADLYADQGRWREADAEAAEAHAIYERIPLRSHPYLVALLTRMCAVEGDLERFDAAMASCDEAVEMARQVNGETHRYYATALLLRARAAIGAGRIDAAQDDFTRARAVVEASQGDHYAYGRVADSFESRLWRLRGEYPRLRDAMISILDEPISKNNRATGTTGPGAAQLAAWAALACLHAPDAACIGRKEQAERILAEPRFARSALRFSARIALAEIDAAQGEPQRTIRDIEGMLPDMESELGGGHSWLGEAHLLLARAYSQTGDRANARAHRAKAAGIIDALPAGHLLRRRLYGEPRD